MHTSVTVTGCIGVWRIQNYELDKSDDHVENCLATEQPPLQPEEFDEFILVEACSGMFVNHNWTPTSGFRNIELSLNFRK